MLREALASGNVEGEDVEDVDSSDNDDDNYVNNNDDDIDGDGDDDDFFVDSTRRELWESERSGKDGGAFGAVGAVGSGEDSVAGGAARASEKGVRRQGRPEAKTNDSRERPFDFGGSGDSSSSSSSSDSGKDRDSDSEEDQDLLAVFAKVSVAPAYEGSDQDDGRDESSHNDHGNDEKPGCETEGLVGGTTTSRTENTDPEVVLRASKPFSAGLSGAETVDEKDCGGVAKEHRGKGKDGKGDEGKGNGAVKGTGHSADEGSDGGVHGGVADRDVGLHQGSSEPSGKRGRRKAGEGKGATGSTGWSTKVGESGPAAVDGDKGARRRRRQAAKASAKEDRGKGGQEDDGLGCRVCGRRFPSRSKLFAHVKSEGHAVLG